MILSNITSLFFIVGLMTSVYGITDTESTSVPTTSAVKNSIFDVDKTRSGVKPLVASDLILYKQLGFIQENVKKMVVVTTQDAKSDPEDLKRLMTSLRLVGEAMELINSIAQDFNQQNSSYNPVIERYFLKMANCLAGVPVEEIEPRHIRKQYQAVKDLNQRITLYCLDNKAFLGNDIKALFNKITTICRMLMLPYRYEDDTEVELILNEEFYKVDFADKFVDYAIYRPWEFVCRYPTPVALALVGLGASVAYYNFFSLHNRNPIYNVEQIRGVRQSPGNTCPYYAILHSLLQSSSQNDQELNARIEQARNIPGIVEPWIQYLEAHVDANIRAHGATNEEIERILQTPDLVNRVMQRIVPEFRFNPDHLIVVNTVDGDWNQLPSDQQIREQLLLGGNLPEHEQQLARIVRFRENVRNGLGCAHIVFNSWGQPGANYRGGHWISVQLERDQNSPHGIRAHVIDPMNMPCSGQANLTMLLHRFREVPVD